MKMLSTRRLLIVVLVVDIILCGLFVLTNMNNKEAAPDRQLPEANIKRICELATLDCFYHNVSEWRKSGNFIGYGAKKLWLEYDGTVRVGIKADQLMISDPDKDNLITVTMPAASILSKDLDENSVYEIDSESPLWGFIPLYDSVNTEERKQALAAAQQDMEASASQNGMIFDDARARAQMIIEKHIIALGEASGKHYRVRFVDASAPQTPPPAEGN